jgi:hypothetical protein
MTHSLGQFCSMQLGLMGKAQAPTFRPMASDQQKPAAFLGVAFENGAQELGDCEDELGAAHHALGVLLHPPAGARDLRFI